MAAVARFNDSRIKLTRYCFVSLISAKLVAKQDYCLATQEHELGVDALAVPLRNARGDTIAALNLVRSGAGPNAPDLATRWLPLLQQTAQALRLLI